MTSSYANTGIAEIGSCVRIEDTRLDDLYIFSICGLKFRMIKQSVSPDEMEQVFFHTTKL
jgi:hypothetical protein